MTGLGAALPGLPVYEATDGPGGICSSYYMRPGATARASAVPGDGNAYRFELGGGHWIFGGDPAVLRLIRSIVPVQSFQRRSAVWLPRQGLLVPYPLQNHLRYLGPELAKKCLREIIEGATARTKVVTMASWLRENFGPTLCELFFTPFHQLYTAGLCEQISPQDGYKSPFDLDLVVGGTFDSSPPVGYNATFIYPEEGLNILAQRMAAVCDIRYGKRATHIDTVEHEIQFSDGSAIGYETLVSTLPLNKMMDLTGLATHARSDPSPSVLVVNIGAEKGPECPEDHWVYIPTSQAGFHRVGFYSNVDRSFLPSPVRNAAHCVSIYVEKAFPEGSKPGPLETAAFCAKVVEELQNWRWIQSTEVVDPTWIEVAYTWSWAGSNWRREALSLLEGKGIFQTGRYARWVFQGIADSIRDGLTVGAAMAASPADRAKGNTVQVGRA